MREGQDVGELRARLKAGPRADQVGTIGSHADNSHHRRDWLEHVVVAGPRVAGHA
jgi:hypothetical protein